LPAWFSTWPLSQPEAGVQAMGPARQWSVKARTNWPGANLDA
jgi:hypothetical protein